MEGNEAETKPHVEKVGLAPKIPEFPLSALQDLYLEMRVPTPIAPTPFNTMYPTVNRLKASERKRILVTGGAGFVGSHLGKSRTINRVSN